MQLMNLRTRKDRTIRKFIKYAIYTPTDRLVLFINIIIYKLYLKFLWVVFVRNSSSVKMNEGKAPVILTITIMDQLLRIRNLRNNYRLRRTKDPV